jgi:hypothetical protein
MNFNQIKYGRNSIYINNSIFVPTVQRVTETIPRVSGKPLYTGTVRYVSSTGNNANTGLNPLLPKLTISSAYTASADGDIIQLLSNIDLANESGGYWLANTTNKGVLVRGTVGNSSAITISHTGAASFIIRMRDTNKLQFQSLTFSHNKAQELIYCECDSPSANVTKWIIFKECIFNFQNNSSNGIFRPVGLNFITPGTGDIFLQIDSCTLSSTKGAGWKWITTDNLPTSATILLQNNTFTSNGFATYSSGDLTRCKSCLYDNTITQNYGGTVLAFSSDTSAPTNLGQIVDLRGNNITVGSGFDPHGILFGRGTDSVYCVNNNVTIPTTSSALAIGFVIKTKSTTIGNSYFGGNYSISPRPFYIKGGSRITASFNSCVSNFSNFAGFEVDNPIEIDSPTGINSILNIITDNNFIGNTYGVDLRPTTATQKPATSMQGWTMDRNNYYGTDSVFLYDNNVLTAYYLSNRTAFWGASSNDANSRTLKTRNINT